MQHTSRLPLLILSLLSAPALLWLTFLALTACLDALAWIVGNETGYLYGYALDGSSVFWWGWWWVSFVPVVGLVLWRFTGFGRGQS